MRFVTAMATTAALAACTSQPAANNANANAGNPAANSSTPAANASPGNAAAAASSGQAQPPAAAYRRYFDERWGHGGAPVTPAEVAAMLASQSPRQVVGALYGNGENSRWDSVASGIAKGDPAWLDLAARLSSGTDAGTSDDFGMAAQDALTTNPTGALRLLTRIPMGTGACSENGFEVPPAQARAYFETAIASVDTVTDPALQQIKTQCIAELRRGLSEYPGLNGRPAQPG